MFGKQSSESENEMYVDTKADKAIKLIEDMQLKSSVKSHAEKIASLEHQVENFTKEINQLKSKLFESNLRNKVIKELGQKILKDFDRSLDVEHLKLFLEHTDKR